MYALILAGGSGTRLWPLSREHLPKQYLTFGRSRRSLFQETAARLLPQTPPEKIIVVTHRDQESEIRRQLSAMELDPDAVTLLCEPQSCNTAPAHRAGGLVPGTPRRSDSDHGGSSFRPLHS